MRFFGFTHPDLIWGFILLEVLSYYYFPVGQIIVAPYTYIGIVFLIIGVILAYIWLPHLKFDTTLEVFERPTKLITEGPYRFSRNPIYLGMAMILFGIAILFGSLSAFIFPIIFLISTDVLVIPVEENNMEKAFGKKYLEYKKKVRRWI